MTTGAAEEVVERVSALLRGTAATAVLPRFGSADTGVSEKRPGDWVTDADLESEALLSSALPSVVPNSTVVGEEGVHADPQVLQRLSQDRPVWLIDPVDGTANFAAGREPFAMMVALVVSGAVTHGWILLPGQDRLVTAVRGDRALLDGRPCPSAGARTRPRGFLPLPALPPAQGQRVEAASTGQATLLPSVWCAGAEYLEIVAGRADFAYFTVSMPWDHAAGALALTVMGGRAAYLDGQPYTPLDESRRGLLVARTPEVWHIVRALLRG